MLLHFRRSHSTTVARRVTSIWADTRDPFLGNDSVNTFPLLGSRFIIIQKLDYNKGTTVSSTWSVPKCYKQGTKSVKNSALEFVKRGLELVMLKNLHC
jgi:hypothetical protein